MLNAIYYIFFTLLKQKEVEKLQFFNYHLLFTSFLGAYEGDKFVTFTKPAVPLVLVGM
jgi:hypothetical protein